MSPEECLYTKEHEWIHVEKDVATIGISDYAAGELGDIVYLELPEPGSSVSQMDPIGTIEAVKTVADLFSPVSGEILEVNGDVAANPEIVNKDPYEEGWFIKIKMSDPGELDVLFDYEEYKEYLGEQEADEHDDDIQEEEDE
ncbi:MAG TPA: glycine cleavage system protein GcvH [Candidatus Eisenbacteria bacterium]|uniref:Glycine cleavage system H protein n=1 Tax=Eiseniibacteriota bacterium TaxID=2212470 RepID=A0A7V2ATA2_UNCEI|nr:glycine cleavage system protein GcvH [Candidatus Eisenbacteria bacterium]